MPKRGGRRTLSTAIELAGLSDTGRSRTNNEDSVFWDAGDRDGTALLIVADGVGGAAAGEIASHEAVAECRSALVGRMSARGLSEKLRSAVERANARIYALAKKEPSYHGMATTLVVCAIKHPQLYVAHVGDSRCYLVREGRSSQVTTDHTWVAQEVEAGRLDEEEAANHPQRNVISRGLGVYPSVEVDISGPLDLRPGDTILACTDGLTDIVNDGEIAEVASSQAPEDASRELVELANSRGGPDNVSVVVARVSGQMSELASTLAAPVGPVTAQLPDDRTDNLRGGIRGRSLEFLD